jgi:hypothetical protein
MKEVAKDPTVSSPFEEDDDEDDEAVDDPEDPKPTSRKRARIHFRDDQILALKVAFIMSSADPRKNSKWEICSSYWIEKGLFGLDRLTFKKE